MTKETKRRILYYGLAALAGIAAGACVLYGYKHGFMDGLRDGMKDGYEIGFQNGGTCIGLETARRLAVARGDLDTADSIGAKIQAIQADVTKDQKSYILTRSDYWLTYRAPNIIEPVSSTPSTGA